MKIRIVVVARVALLTALAPLVARAQSDPSNFATVINVPADPAPSEIGSSTQLNLTTGGVLPESFLAGALDGSSTNVELNVYDGLVGDDLVTTGSMVNIFGGELGDILPRGSSTVTVTGGRLGQSRSVIEDGSTLTFRGGSLEADLQIYDTAALLLEDGVLTSGDHGSRARDGSTVRMSGGAIVGEFTVERDADFRLAGGTVSSLFDARNGGVELVGGEFKLNGVDYAGTELLLTGDDIFTGVLEDGTPFLFSLPASDSSSTASQFKATITPATVPGADTSPIIVDGASPVGPAGLRAGQLLTLRDGGALGHNFAVVDSDLVIEGGAVKSELEVVRGSISVSGGVIGAERPGRVTLRAYDSSSLSITGGRVAGRIQALSGSSVDISGGEIEVGVYAYDGSVVAIEGGRFGSSSRALAGAQMTISGGTIEQLFVDADAQVVMSGGTLGEAFYAASGSQLQLLGGEFRLNGEPHAATTIGLVEGDVFTGTLADGSPFIFSYSATDRLFGVALSQASLPTADLSPIVVDAGSPAGPAGLRSGQSLELRQGGSLERNFAVVDATLVVAGGTVGAGLELIGADVNVSSGAIEGMLRAYAGTTIQVSGGRIEEAVLEADVRLTSNGGVVQQVVALPGSEVHVGGGILGIGSIERDAELHLYGSGFALDGELVEGLSWGQPSLLLRREATLTGVLTDGTPIEHYLNSRGSQFPRYYGDIYLTPILPGDFNHDGLVDAADYSVWRDSLGATDVALFASGDGNGDGLVTIADYDVWKAGYLTAGGTNAPGPAPEPAAVWAVGVALVITSARQGRQR